MRNRACVRWRQIGHDLPFREAFSCAVPHNGGFQRHQPWMRWPKLREVIARDLKHVSEETRACLLRENVRELYRLPALTSLPA
jgi:hypothetical protein